MLINITDPTEEESSWDELVFDDGRGNGFVFPCHEDGTPKKPMNEGAMENYEYCLKHPEKFSRFNEVIHRETSWRNPRIGTCECGETFPMLSQYQGALQCPKCGQWYSLSGQELLPPDRWGWDGTEL